MYDPDARFSSEPFFDELEDPLFWESVSGRPISLSPLPPQPTGGWRPPTRYIIIEEQQQPRVIESWLQPVPPPISTALTFYDAPPAPMVQRVPAAEGSTYQPIPAKGHNLLLSLCGLSALVFLLGILFNLFTVSRTAPPIIASTTGYSLVGAPSVSADFINRVLARFHSPAVGEGQTIYDDGVKYGIDAVFALAFFMHESSFGTTGEARDSLSIGNLRCLDASYDYLSPTCIDNYAWFPTWGNGIEAWYRLIKVGYVQGAINQTLGSHACPCVTLAQIVPVYAPRADGNDEVAYIAAVKQEVNSWRRGSIAPA